MAVLKCKMCGGELNITKGSTIAECEYCGSRQTIPSQDSEKKLTLFARADRLRRAGEFDKAAGVYESIVADFPEEAEAYWGLVLSRYGIEYVDDSATGKRVPTCHRSSFDGILEDADFDQACENADPIARRLYRDEAKAIEDIRKGILEVSGREEPYDIFICYKETDENGSRTLDSVIAQDVYDALTEKGYRVFFSRISLEDKLGTEYEPYIFAALNSAKVMLVFGTDYEYFNAVWVKNEWSRFLKLMTRDKSKHLIPCYKNVDAYDMPREFAKFQAQDMGKVGAVQDLLRGIGKILNRGARTEAAPTPVVPVASAAPGVESLLKRAWMFLEDSEWKNADEYFDRVLDIEPECARAYAGKLCAERRKVSLAEVAEEDSHADVLSGSGNYKKALRFADDALRAELERCLESVKQNQARREVEEERCRQEEAAQEARRHREEMEEEKRRREEADARLKLLQERLGKAALLIAAGAWHTVGLKADGVVVAAGANRLGECNVSGWCDIVAVAAGYSHTVGLKSDGTVVAVGLGYKCDVGEWQGITAIAASDEHTVGLKADGSVVAAGENDDRCDVNRWRNIVAVAAGGSHTVGLKSDRTVVARGENGLGQCDVTDWKDVISIAAGTAHTVGLTWSGTVVAAGDNTEGQCNVGAWRDIVAVAAGDSHTVGLKADGTVVAAGNNWGGRCNVDRWTDIVAVAAGSQHTVGLKSDGTLVAVGNNEDGRCNVTGWKLFYSIDPLEQKRAEAEERRAALKQEKQSLQTELAALRGFFSSLRRKEIEARLAELEAELDSLK